MSVPPGDQIYKQNADTCQAEAFSVSAFNLFLYAIIISEPAWAVKQTGMPSAVDKSRAKNAVIPILFKRKWRG